MKRGQEYMGRYVRIDTGVIDISSPIYQLYRYLDCQYVSIRNIDTCGAVSPSLVLTDTPRYVSVMYLAPPTNRVRTKRELQLNNDGLAPLGSSDASKGSSLFHLLLITKCLSF